MFDCAEIFSIHVQRILIREMTTTKEEAMIQKELHPGFSKNIFL